MFFSLLRDDRFLYLQDLKLRWFYLLFAAFVSVLFLCVEIFSGQPFDFLVINSFITISFCASYLFLRTEGSHRYYQQAILINAIFHNVCYVILFAWSGSAAYMVPLLLAMVLAPIAFEMNLKNSTIFLFVVLFALIIIPLTSSTPVEPFEFATICLFYVGATYYTLISRGLFIKIAVENAEFQNQLQLEKEKTEDNNKSLQELDRSKTKLLSILAHDIRGPLNNIRSMLHLSNSRGKLTAVERQSLELHIIESVDSTIELLDKVLEWSHYQATDLSVRRETVHLSSTVEKVFDLYRHTAASKNIQLINNIAMDVQAESDNAIINLVLRNLIGNAIKFTKEGSVAVNCKLYDYSLEVAVSDTGIGIKPGESLFSNINNISRLGTANEKGTGFGLILCKQFISKIGGTIAHRPNENGIGSCFVFSIPVKQNLRQPDGKVIKFRPENPAAPPQPKLSPLTQ